MKHTIVFAVILFSITALSAQNNEPPEVTPQSLQKIKADVEKQAAKFRETLSRQDMTSNEIEFSVDTFKIEQTASKRMSIDPSTLGINNAIGEMTGSYDKIMNKYYNRLLQMLKP